MRLVNRAEHPICLLRTASLVDPNVGPFLHLVRSPGASAHSVIIATLQLRVQLATEVWICSNCARIHR